MNDLRAHANVMISLARWSVLALVLLLAVAVVVKRMPRPPLNVVPPGALRTHYLLDYESMADPATGEATMGHLVVLNPGGTDATLQLTAYFEDRDPASFTMVAPARASSESNYSQWPVEGRRRFALKVESSVPVFCQATVGWNNTSNDYDFEATTGSAARPREVAKSYASITALADHWYVSDGYIIDKPGRTWVRESEWLILLNPHPEDLAATLTILSHGESTDERLLVGGLRVRWVEMDEHAPLNQHYGARVTAPTGFAAQWVRTVRWQDNDELMTEWSMPLSPLSKAAPVTAGRR